MLSSQGVLVLAVAVVCLSVHGAYAVDFDTEKAFDEVGILKCSMPKIGTRVRPPYPLPDWENMYSKLDVQTKRIYEVVEGNPKEMHIQNLRSDGLLAGNSSHRADLELVVYERGGLSSDTLQAINSIGSDDIVLDWLRDNNQEDWSSNNENVRAIPRKRPTDGKLRVVFIFGEHGRELVTTEVGEYFIKLLSEASVETLLPIFDNDRLFVDSVLKALDDTVVHIVPCENKSARRIVETEDGPGPRTVKLLDEEVVSKYPSNICQRPNVRGVDPNRNWPLYWNVKSSRFQLEQEYGGPAALSEPETRLLFRVYDSVEPLAVVNVHSGMHGMFSPPDYSPIMLNTAASLAEMKLQSQLNQRWMDGKCTVGAGGHAVGYVAYGTHNDFVHTGFGVPSAETWEVYGNERSEYYDCFGLFNPIEKDVLKEYVRNWTGMALEHITHLHQGLIPGIRSPADKFSEEVASLPEPNTCGLTESHVNAMRGLSDLALGRGDKLERSSFVANAMASTPTLIMPTLQEEEDWDEEDSAPSTEMGDHVSGAKQARTAGGSSEGKPSINVSNGVPSTTSVVEDLKKKVMISRTASSSYSFMLGSYSIMIFGITFVTVSYYVYRRFGFRSSGRRRPRRYRVWDVV
mmetsp:Transcript_5178/g.15565  ORF Transcript_5178/g.15565 Transcript_5178/m.15565 type:complete len:630 (-) Transcript_5178:36-1925(-)